MLPHNVRRLKPLTRGKSLVVLLSLDVFKILGSFLLNYISLELNEPEEPYESIHRFRMPVNLHVSKDKAHIHFNVFEVGTFFRHFSHINLDESLSRLAVS